MLLFNSKAVLSRRKPSDAT